MFKKINKLMIVVIILAMITPVSVFGAGDDGVQFTILHTNDFHGNLEADYRGRGGSANLAGMINRIKAEKNNVLLMDAGDVYFASPAISQLLMGESTIDIYNMMGYNLAAFGNHEFDKGQEELQARVEQSNFPWLGANVVLEGTEWELPEWAQAYRLISVGARGARIKVAVLGLAGEETPEVTLIGTTEGLVFKDLTETILHYYDEIMVKADALIVIAHMGTNDSGPYDGLETVAQKLIDAGKPVDLMIGGHQHQAIFEPVYVGDTAIVSAGYYGRYLGQVDVSVDAQTKKLMVEDYVLHTINDPPVGMQDLVEQVHLAYEEGLIYKYSIYNALLRKLAYVQMNWDGGFTSGVVVGLQGTISFLDYQSGKNIDPEAADALIATIQEILDTLPDLAVAARVAYWAEIVAPIVNEPVGYTNISLTRDYNDESIVGDIVTDSMLWKADNYDDGELNGSVDIAFTNPGGLRGGYRHPRWRRATLHRHLGRDLQRAAFRQYTLPDGSYGRANPGTAGPSRQSVQGNPANLRRQLVLVQRHRR